MWISYPSSKWRSCVHIYTPIMVVIEPQVRSLITLEQMSFWYLFLEQQLTTYHSNVGVHWKEVTELGTSTFNLAQFWAFHESDGAKFNEVTTKSAAHLLVIGSLLAFNRIAVTRTYGVTSVGFGGLCMAVVLLLDLCIMTMAPVAGGVGIVFQDIV